MSRETGSPPEEVTRKLSKTVLHAAERGRSKLFEKLTAANSERIAELTREKPRFFEERENAPRQLLLEPEVARALPEKFFINPTQWLEAQPNIERGHTQEELPTGETIAELWQKPYDVSKVKQFNLPLADGKNIGIVSKRLRPKELEEVARARRAFEAGIPTPRILGEILDRGNAYVLFEYIPGINLQAAYSNAERENFSVMPHRTFEETTEDQFDIAMKHLGKNLPKDLRVKLKSLWQKAMPDIQEAFLLGSLIRGFYGRLPQELIQMMTVDFKRRTVGYERILRHFKLSSIAELVKREMKPEVLHYGFRYDTPKVRKLIEQAEKRLTPYRNKWEAKLSLHFFGVDVLREKKKIQDLLDRAKISHKDLAMRNFVIPWDFKTDRPAKHVKGQPGLYLVDWETGRSSR